MYSCKTEFFEIELFICIKMDLALNNLLWLICHKTKLDQTKPNTNKNIEINQRRMMLWFCKVFLKPSGLIVKTDYRIIIWWIAAVFAAASTWNYIFWSKIPVKIELSRYYLILPSRIRVCMHSAYDQSIRIRV